MALSLFINFDGNCREAVEFYSTVFNTEIQNIMTFGDAPPDPKFPLNEEMKNLVMYTFLKIGDSNIMFSDVLPGMPLTKGNNISLTVGIKDENELKAAFEKLKEGGSVQMELQQTFFSKCYGFLTDKFGIPWQIMIDDGTSSM